ARHRTRQFEIPQRFVRVSPSSRGRRRSDKTEVTTAVSFMVNERADQAALEHFQKNLSALARSQGELMDVSAEMLSGLTWLAGRDGALTAQDAAGSWVTGCSLPRRAAEAMLESMQSRRGAVCLVAPTHAAQVRGALARLDGSQAVLAIVPEATIAAFILAGDD